MKHGGDILSYKHLFDGTLKDFSSNINPLGPPNGLREKILEAFNEITMYPDIHYRNLKKNIAGYLGCGENEVMVGNGAVEIINNVTIMFRKVVVFIPCFIEYAERAEVNNRIVVKLKLDDNFEINTNLLEANLEEGDLLILGNPNNPTGRRIKKEKLIEIHRIVEDKKAFLLLDEAFYEFCPEDYDSISIFAKSRDVCIIRAATKFFALPGIRLGYAFSNEGFIKNYNRTALPWSINIFADSASQVIFYDRKYIEASREYIHKQREYLLNELEKINIIKPYGTDANFILIKLLKGSADNVLNFFITRGILVRKASSFDGLDSSYIRVAIRGSQDNRHLVKCFEEYTHYISK